MKEGGKGKAKYDKSFSKKGKGRSARVYHNNSLSWRGKSQQDYDDFCAQEASASNFAAMQNAVPAPPPPPKPTRGSSVEAAPKKARTTPQEEKNDDEPAETQPCPDTLAAAAAATPTAMAEGGLGRGAVALGRPQDEVDVIDDDDLMLDNLRHPGPLPGIDPILSTMQSMLDKLVHKDLPAMFSTQLAKQSADLEAKFNGTVASLKTGVEQANQTARQALDQVTGLEERLLHKVDAKMHEVASSTTRSSNGEGGGCEYSWKSQMGWIKDQGGFKLLFGGFPISASNDEIRKWIDDNLSANPTAQQCLDFDQITIKGFKMKLASIPMQTKCNDNTDKMFDCMNTLKALSCTFQGTHVWISYEKPPHIRERNSKMTQARDAMTRMPNVSEADVIMRYSENYIEFKGDIVANFDTKMKRILWSQGGCQSAGVNFATMKAKHAEVVKETMNSRRRTTA